MKTVFSHLLRLFHNNVVLVSPFLNSLCNLLLTVGYSDM